MPPARPEPIAPAKAPKDQPPRRIDRLVFMQDAVGWTVDRRRHLFVAEVSSGQVRQLTDGDLETGSFAWSPDGKMIAFASGRHPTWDRDFAQDLFTVSVDDGVPVKLTNTDKAYAAPSWSPDGASIAFVVVPGGATDTPTLGSRHAA